MTIPEIVSSMIAYAQKQNYKRITVTHKNGKIYTTNADDYWLTAKGLAESATNHVFINDNNDEMTYPLLDDNGNMIEIVYDAVVQWDLVVKK